MEKSEFSNGKGGSAIKKKTVRRKKPTLSQQVEDQAALINNLYDDLHRKEDEIKALVEKNKSMDELSISISQIEKLLNENGAKEESEFEKLTPTEAISERFQELEIKLKASKLQRKHLVAQNAIKSHMVAGSAMSFLPLPLFDLAALSGTQLNLLRVLCKNYDVNFDEQKGKAILTSLISGSLPLLTVMGLSSFARLLPGIGTIGGSISMTIFSSAYIYATGQVFLHHFEYGGTLENFESKHWRKFFKEKFSEKRYLAKEK